MGGVWRKKITLGNATAIPEEIAFGTSMTHYFALAKWTLAADMRDLTLKAGSEGEKSINRRIHLGTELGFLPVSGNQHFLTLRLGYNQGYPTFGLEFFFTRATVIGYTDYIEETGEYAGQKPSSRRIFYLSLGF